MVLDKVTAFLIRLLRGLSSDAGANGVLMAEPLAGLLSPDLAEEFSCTYVRKIVDAVQDRRFRRGLPQLRQRRQPHDSRDSVHRLRRRTTSATPSTCATCCPRFPRTGSAWAMWIPRVAFRHGTPESIREVTLALMKDLTKYPNFVISSGCDIPPMFPSGRISTPSSAPPRNSIESVNEEKPDKSEAGAFPNRSFCRIMSLDCTEQRSILMKLGIGIDTGGTYTDAVIFDYETRRVLDKSKALTTHEGAQRGHRPRTGRTGSGADCAGGDHRVVHDAGHQRLRGGERRPRQADSDGHRRKGHGVDRRKDALRSQARGRALRGRAHGLRRLGGGNARLGQRPWPGTTHGSATRRRWR